jgi:ABC-type transport system involved in cytochrome c biogenesis permease subunit
VKWLSDPKNPGNKKFDLYFGAPLQAGQQWQGIALAIPAFQGGAPVNESIAVWCDIAKALRDGRTTDFNRIISDYDRKVTAHPPVGGEKAGFETFFNRFDPFLICMVLYVGVFLFAVVSWLGFRRPLVRTAVAVALLSLLVHSFGLLARMYISGRPPVTSLYSAAVFIGWGSVILCLFLELLYRNGIGAAGAGILGFASLLVAGGLYLQGADQLGQLQAVLDTNFWLATHVVTITLGYATMFVAGLLGTAYVIGGMFTNSLSPDTRKTLGKMTYGIVCFAMLLSFVGTILGGIWADQSWGRFWGWDPKENGAILIVLWNAIFLHARWCGLVRERGMAVLAIFGNIVTAWSMFGTNMLGVGLHSYGFMEAAMPWVKGYVMFQVLVMILGCLPLSLWRSFAAPEPATR